MKSTVIVILIVAALANTNKLNETFMGIKLGTTSSCSVLYKDGRVSVNVIPSYVAFTNGEILIGTKAKNQAKYNPENTVFGVKRLIGKDWGGGVKEDIKAYPFKVFEKNNKPYISVNTSDGTKDFSPEEITAMVIKHLKDSAEEYLGTNVEAAVITVPAYFNADQRQVTKEAGKIAGLNVLSVTNEPTAAAVAYGLDKKEGDTNVLVYHLGGATCAVTVLTVDNGVFEVVATHGDSHLGGQDFNQRIMGYFIEQYEEKGINVMTNLHAIQILGEEIEKAKQILSSRQQVNIEIKSFHQEEDFVETLTREKFEELNMDLFTSTMVLVKKVLRDAEMTVENINEIVLLGGSTRIPKISQLLVEYFNQSIQTRFSPVETAAYGAAIQAHMLSKEGYEMEWNANPISIGIETANGVMLKIIPSFTFIPAKKTQMISTSIDNQEILNIKIFQGERYLAKDNNFLGEIELKGITAAARGEPQIEVTLELDVNGVLHVKAEDKATGSKENTDIVIPNVQTRMRLGEIEEFFKDAKKFHKIDKYHKERVEARTEYENTLFSLEKQIKELDSTGKDQLLLELERTNYYIPYKTMLDIHKRWLEENYLDGQKEDFETQLMALQIVIQPFVNEYLEKYKDEL